MRLNLFFLAQARREREAQTLTVNKQCFLACGQYDRTHLTYFINQPKHHFPMVLPPVIRTPSSCFYPPFSTPWFDHSNPVPSMIP